MTQTEKELTSKIYELEYRITQISNELLANIKRNEHALQCLKTVMESAITKAVHELIEYLRQEDIQALDEQEFAEAVDRLIWEADPDNYLPF